MTVHVYTYREEPEFDAVRVEEQCECASAVVVEAGAEAVGLRLFDDAALYD